MRPHLSVVVPVYNSEGTLDLLVDRTTAVLTQLGHTHEFVLVDDGSSDGSLDRIRGIAARYPNVRGISLTRNYGQHNALLAGTRAARGELILTIDDDLQHPPEEIHKLLRALQPSVDVVYGSPGKLPHSLGRNVASWLTKLALQKAMGVDTARSVSAFRLFRTPLREAFARYQSPMVSLDVLLTWATTRFTHVLTEHHQRTIGPSNYTLRKLIKHALTTMTGFSTIPLRFASMIGFGFTLFGFLVLVYVVGVYSIQGGSVRGFSFLASIIAIFSGTQLFALGLIGEYLASVHIRVMDRPAYVIGEIYESAADGAAPPD